MLLIDIRGLFIKFLSLLMLLLSFTSKAQAALFCPDNVKSFKIDAGRYIAENPFDNIYSLFDFSKKRFYREYDKYDFNNCY